eukprot:scaffold9077_cov92-Skeletonema_marinoi.AAC.4
MDDAAAANDNTREETPRDDGVKMDIDGNLGLADGAEEDDDDDADDESFKSEDIPSDDISTAGDDDELEYDSDDDVEMKPKGYTLNVTEATLGEESKALLIWREDDEKSFSDWKIKVVAEGEDEGNENATVYSVHRSVLALGPKKSGYFEALFNESSSDCVTTVKLSEEVAAHFPHFLDYMYSQPVESKATVNFATWKSMAYFAHHFLVPRLTEDVVGFIRKDMYDLDHMESYLFSLGGIDCDVSNHIRYMAPRVCVEMIQSIQADSSLLKSIPHAMFSDIMSTLGRSGFVRSATDEDRDHVHGLVIGYLDRIDDESSFYDLSCMMSVVFFEYDDVKIAGNRALDWLRLMKHKGWESYWLAIVCTNFLRNYLYSQELTANLMSRVVKEVPDDIVANLFRESLLQRRGARVQQVTEVLRFNVTLTHNWSGKRLRLDDIELPKAASTEAISALKCRLLRAYVGYVYVHNPIYLLLTHNGVLMDDKEPISTYPIFSQEDNLIEVEWKVFS